MAASKNTLLLNAEPFGFGPAAAIAAVAPLLQEQGLRIGYIGEGHTLDLQRTISYEDLYDTTGLGRRETQQAWQHAAKKYGTCLTAMDFVAAEEARSAGMRVAIYDALAWFWPRIPSAARSADLYLAQNFFGVEKRVTTEVAPYTATLLVPPLVTRVSHNSDAKTVLLNLGGLQHPGWRITDAAAYAAGMIAAVRATVSEQLVITTSAAVAHMLQDPAVVTKSAQEMHELLTQTKLAIMTPGLGNIYDAAAHNVPTIWLPPANDSQGRQAALLKEHSCADAIVEWSDVTDAVDMSQPQPTVLQTIIKRTQVLQSSRRAATRLRAALRKSYADIANQKASSGAALLDLFGSGGATAIAAGITKFMKG